MKQSQIIDDAISKVAKFYGIDIMEVTSLQVAKHLAYQVESQLDALQRVDKAIDDMNLGHRFGHTQSYVKSAINSAIAQ